MNDRQTGRTTTQMTEAPRGAFFIWPSASLTYPKALAHHLGRADLLIVARIWLTIDNVAGRKCPGVILDHATELSHEQWTCYQILKLRSKEAS